MKKTILNLGAILMAFIIGVTINNACASKIDNMSDSELRNLVSQLQQEVNSLKERVAELEEKIGGSSGRNSGSTSTGALFEVDGLLFFKDGNVASPIDYYTTGQNAYQIINGERSDITNTSQYSYKFNYDSKGRISSTEMDVNGHYKSITQYTYSNKTRTAKIKTTYDQTLYGGLAEGGSETVYYYK